MAECDLKQKKSMFCVMHMESFLICMCNKANKTHYTIKETLGDCVHTEVLY